MTLAGVPRRCRHVDGVTLRPLPALLWVDLSLPLAGGEQDDVSAEEHRKASRFRCADDRRRYLAAHAALRRTLAACGAGEARSLHFRSNAWGKPELCEPGGPHFNLSHSADIGLIGSSFSHDIGVDVEFMRALPDAAALVREHFTFAERQEFERLPPAARDRAFLIGWTRKEACLKAVGCGLSVDTSAIEVGLAGSTRVVEIALGGERCIVEVHSTRGHRGVFAAVAQVRSRGIRGLFAASPAFAG